MRFAFVVPRPFPTVNDWHGAPPWVYSELRRVWLREFPPSTALTRPAGRRAVSIVRVYPQTPGQRRFDPDNLKGGAKPVLDALRQLGWLKNDTPKWCSLDVEQRHPMPGERAPQTLVTVEDIP